ncbi:phosphate uptake regulator PhoU [Candidatus Woesearchaeota archaeon]|nr:phosphate uptake regulator PhoU [Candidatus Woesearchaeota archaeon]
MKRKVSQIGPATLMVSLPSKWVKKYGVKKGDELNIEEKDKILELSKEGIEKPLMKTEVNISNMSEKTTRWILSSLHKKGYDEIKIHYSTPFELENIKLLINKLLIGFIIIETTNKYVVLKSLSKDDEAVFENLLKRSFLVTKEMAKETLQNLRENNIENLKKTIQMEHTNNQLSNICQRLINKGIIAKNPSFYYVIIWNLEKVCDDYKYICSLKIKEPEAIISQDILILFDNIINFLNNYYDYFYDFSFDKLIRLNKEKQEILDKINHLSNEKRDKVETVLLQYLHSNTLKIVDFSTSIIAIREKH